MQVVKMELFDSETNKDKTQTHCHIIFSYSHGTSWISTPTLYYSVFFRIITNHMCLCGVTHSLL